MSALIVYTPPQGQYEASLRQHYGRVRRVFSEAVPPPERPPPPRPLSPFHPLRIAAEQKRLAALWERPASVIYDFGPGHIGLMMGSRRRKHTDITITKECELIADQVAKKHKIDLSDITSNRRDRRTSAARQEIFWRCRHETSSSIPAIGRLFNRDHTTVLFGISQHQKKIDGGEAK
jgi:hypothetical protein